ncbi:predicted protein, partial [Nematostella vectensis]
LSYTLHVYEAACYYWDERSEGWGTDGCMVGKATRPGIVECMCDHLTAFGANFRVLPTSVVPPVVTTVSKADLPYTRPIRTPLVLALVMTAFACYLIMLVWARREDIRDDKRAEIYSLDDNSGMDKGHYDVTVYTGMSNDAGTTSTVCCLIEGDRGQTTPRALFDPSRIRFKRGAEDSFYLTTPEPLGTISDLTVWHSDSGRSPSWYLRRIVVSDLISGKSFIFLCERWLAVEYDDGQVSRSLSVASGKEINNFRHLFYSNVKSAFVDHHIWVSVLFRPAKSNFTRVQRLSCCLLLFLAIILGNIILRNV